MLQKVVNIDSIRVHETVPTYKIIATRQIYCKGKSDPGLLAGGETSTLLTVWLSSTL